MYKNGLFVQKRIYFRDYFIIIFKYLIMNTFGWRLRMVMQTLNLKNADVAKLTERTPQRISDYVTERSEPNFDFITKLVEVIPNINLNWLIAEKGAMLLDGANSSLEELTTLKNELEELKAERRNLISSLGAMSQSFSTRINTNLAKLKAVCKTAGFKHKLTFDELLMLNATPVYTVGLHS